MTQRDTDTTGAGGIFADPQALSFEKHGGLRLKQIPDGFGFARSQHVVPVTAQETLSLATHYPIIFVGPQQAPCAVMGLGEPVNLFVSKDGAFAEDAEPPAALRQYPFFLKSDAAKDQMVLCIDRSAPHFSETEGEPLFEDGKASKVASDILQYLSVLDQQRRVTASFVDQLKKMDLFTTQEMKGRGDEANPEERRTIATYVTVNEKKLNELGDAERGELARNGFLQVCYAILISQYNWRKLILRAQKRGQAAKTN